MKLSDLRRLRRNSATMAEGSARPDSKARRTTSSTAKVPRCLRHLSDSEAEKLFDNLYSLADVFVQAFIERRSRSVEASVSTNVSAVATPSQLLTPQAA
jgi:hypothetical protein